MTGPDPWWGGIPKSEFERDYFHKVPYSASADAKQLAGLCDWATVERILAQRDVDAMVCRQGERYDGPVPASADAARRLRDEGYTILVRHAERNDPQLQGLAESFARDFGGKVNVHVYATPEQQFGFGWHYDAEDVFILQTAGAKEYALRKNTVHPWPVIETIPDDMQFERESMPLMRCLLKAGDWLYIPAGYWHMGTAREASVSLAVGVLSPTALDVHDLARQRLAGSLIWRQRLPTVGAAASLQGEQLRDELRRVLAFLARDLSELYRSEEFLDALLERLS